VTAVEQRIGVENVIDHIPHRDHVEGTIRQVKILGSATDNVVQLKFFASVSDSGGRNLRTVRLPVGKLRDAPQEKPETTSQVEQASRSVRNKLRKEILIHLVASLTPIRVAIVGHALAPESIVVRIRGERREYMVAVQASQNVYIQFPENNPMPQTSTEQTLPRSGLLTPCRYCSAVRNRACLTILRDAPS
jgi:hypothetical protein